MYVVSGVHTLGVVKELLFFLPPVEGEDYIALSAVQLVWPADNPRVCTNITLVDDQKVENDEYFFVTMDRIVTPSANPILDRRPLIVLIMDEDGMSVCSSMYHRRLGGGGEGNVSLFSAKLEY